MSYCDLECKLKAGEKFLGKEGEKDTKLRNNV